MASKSVQIENLQKVNLLAGLTKRDLQHIAKAGDVIKMTDGTTIVDQGQMGREAFVILSGSIGVRRNGRKIATLGEGSVVGELSLLDHGPRTATAICEGDCTLFVLDQRHFRKVLEDQPGIALKLLNTLAGYIRNLDRQYFG
jgi:CRP/FNR family transcriptional regulator, cyclic AMP receptor protein